MKKAKLSMELESTHRPGTAEFFFHHGTSIFNLVKSVTGAEVLLNDMRFEVTPMGDTYTRVTINITYGGKDANI